MTKDFNRKKNLIDAKDECESRLFKLIMKIFRFVKCKTGDDGFDDFLFKVSIILVYTQTGSYILKQIKDTMKGDFF